MLFISFTLRSFACLCSSAFALLFWPPSSMSPLPLLHHASHASLASRRYSIDRACRLPESYAPPESMPSHPANAIPLHHCSIWLPSLLFEHLHLSGSRLHLAELLRLATVDPSQVLCQQRQLKRVAHVLGDCAFALTSFNMFRCFPHFSTAAPTFCTSRIHITSASSSIFAPPPTLCHQTAS